VKQRIVLMVEGYTEAAFIPTLRGFLQSRLDQMPKLDPRPWNGPMPKGEKLRNWVMGHLTGREPADAVIALTDVYTGDPRRFQAAADAKRQMRDWVGEETRFHPHVALHDFEAWLLPYWRDIQRLTGTQKKNPGIPEQVNHDKPPAEHLKESFATGKNTNHYRKVHDATRILQGKDLALAAAACPELKSFLNTILRLCGGAGL